MVVDSSALVAILCDETERVPFNAKIEADPTRLISAGSLLEASLIIESRYGEHGRAELDLFIYTAGIRIVPFDADQLAIAREAFRKFGQGRHKARLNLGDCFAYALAKSMGEPLLYKGGDFAHTDLAAC
jgi:ribonuclease VapC